MNSISQGKNKFSRYQTRRLIEQAIPKEMRNGLSYSLKSRLQSIALSQDNLRYTAFLIGLINEIEKMCEKGIRSHRKLKEVSMCLSEFDHNIVIESPWLS